MSCRRAIAALAIVFVPAWSRAQEKLSSTELAAAIDRLIEAKWKDAGAEPAPLADDADFLRRLSVDLVGRIPRVSEVRAFLDDEAADKRTKLVDELLAGNAHVAAMGEFWRKIIVVDATNNPFGGFQNPQLKTWLDKQVRDNVPYDKLVREILAGPTGFQPNRFGRGQGQIGGQIPQYNPGAQAFYAMHQNKPESIASSVSRQFLGVRLECAQCHDHPFASWKRKQFWSMAAFFSQMQPLQPRVVINGKVVQPGPVKPREIKIPDTEHVVPARFMDGAEPEWKDDSDSRGVLADWVTSPKNPYFAKHAVNRLWAHFFGPGLVDPIDDEPTDENPVSHPELLDLLAQQFVASGYDVKHLVRAFTATKTYQRSSRQTHPSQADARLWARMPVRGLTGEQLYDSLAIATGLKNAAANQFNGGFNQPRFEFLTRFGSQERPTERQTSILQALSMMNGKFTGDVTSLATGSTLGAIVDAPFLSTRQKIETLYLATLSRMPRPEELRRHEAYVARGDSRTALADVFWVLLNSTEFAVNR